MKFDETPLYYIETNISGIRKTLFDLATWKNGLAFKKIDFSNTGIPIIKIAELNNGINENTSYTQSYYGEDVFLKMGDLLFAWSGNPQTSINAFKFRLPNGWLNQHIFKVTAKSDVNQDYLYYLLKYLKYNFTKIAQNKQTTGLGHVTISDLKRISIILPNLDIQKKIVSILKPIDDKIELNRAVNENLERQAQAIFNKMFVFTSNEQRKKCRAEEYFDISIGKTPPRNEHQWFTTNSNDVPWISISDMGKNEIYISRSSENLTKEAVDKFNIKIIPNNTVILSFKLTIGRVLITNGKMTSNEAIAHFKTDKIFINEYLYFYLKNFRYQIMGNTSSIATAVNSKIIKSMPFVIPTDNEINNFHLIVKPIFKQILSNTLENEKLADLRDTLLPRLMSGELDVSIPKCKI